MILPKQPGQSGQLLLPPKAYGAIQVWVLLYRGSFGPWHFLLLMDLRAFGVSLRKLCRRTNPIDPSF
jgi:hypothetical protein